VLTITAVVQREVEKLLLGFEVAQLEDKINARFGIGVLSQHLTFGLAQRKIQLLFMHIKRWQRIKFFDFRTG